MDHATNWLLVQTHEMRDQSSIEFEKRNSKFYKVRVRVRVRVRLTLTLTLALALALTLTRTTALRASSSCTCSRRSRWPLAWGSPPSS